MNYANNQKLTYNLRYVIKVQKIGRRGNFVEKSYFLQYFTYLSSNKKLLHFGVSELINRLMKCIKFMGQIARFSKKQK